MVIGKGRTHPVHGCIAVQVIAVDLWRAADKPSREPVQTVAPARVQVAICCILSFPLQVQDVDHVIIAQNLTRHPASAARTVCRPFQPVIAVIPLCLVYFIGRSSVVPKIL